MPCCCKQLSSASSYVLLVSSPFSLAGSYFPDTCRHMPSPVAELAEATATVKYTPKAVLRTSAQLLHCAVGINRAMLRLHQPSFKDAFTASSSIVVIVQSLSQPHAAYLYGSQVTALAPFFGSPDASSHTYYVTATVKLENLTQRNPSVHPGKLLKPSHFPR